MSDAADVRKVVILAAGLGKRMRQPAGDARLAAVQAAAADTGVKALIPFARPFLDYSLSTLADAGFRQVCLVIGPQHQQIRDYYTRVCPPQRVKISFAVQSQPRGTADAVRVAEKFTDGELFLMINSDNYYPVSACRAARKMRGPGIIAFERDAMLNRGNIQPERISGFAAVKVAPGDLLEDVLEKPSPETLRTLGPRVWLSMNCWLFDRRIFTACERIGPSPRGELEIPDAVRLAIHELGVRFEVVRCDDPVLDLSSRRDIESIAPFLERLPVSL